MAITGIDTIEGKQIIAAGAVSAKSAEMAYNDENGNPITGYLTAVPEGYATTGDLTAYQLTADMTGYQSAGDYYSASNPSGFLVADDITGKLDASIYATDSGNFLTAIPDTYLQNTDLSTTDGKVTAISGIPLSAGGDVPEGVMVESGLEYNAVDEISGYNGSAFAQYGAEKQWLVHDDTLVHASNSAQYALGVNLSAVAQLLGVDETVLWSGEGSTACTLTTTPSAFDRIRFYGYRDEGVISNSRGVFEFPTQDMTGYDLSLLLYNNDGTYRALYLSRYVITGTDCSLSYHQHLATPTGTLAWGGMGTCPIKITKVIGIGRKQ